MDTLDFAMNFENNEQSDADKKLFVVFYKDVIKNERKSVDAGRPVFDEINLVKIITPGSRDSFVGDATPDYQERFPRQWSQFAKGMTQELSGTPLNQLPWLSMSQIAEFNAVGVHTVEHLVSMSDANSSKFMAHHQIKQRAQAYLDAAKESAPAIKLQAEIQKRDEQLNELKAANQALVQRLEALEKNSSSKVPAKA